MEVGDYVLIREKSPLKVDVEENGYLFFSKLNGNAMQYWRYSTKKKQLHAVHANKKQIVIFHHLVLDITLLHPYTFT